ncbi:MIP family transporter [Metarhizium robertsii]|uniref:MIP family transporter n=1 Tax=Metarhizium robertsii TaxID=568076 RepID=A0A0A1V3S2_9HYPO|nr:MIP family transporter [Metarhizium robertsii]
MRKHAAPSSPTLQSVMPSLPPTPDRVSEEAKPILNRGMTIAAFDGSFAPLVRPTVRRKTPWYKDRDYFLAGWLSPAIWKAAVVEAIATSCLVYVSLLAVSTLASYNTPRIGGYIGIFNTILLTIFIYATSPASGGHINPMITFSAILAGICPLPRGSAKDPPSTSCGIIARLIRRPIHGGGCFFTPSVTSAGQVFLNEVAASFVILYLSYGVGLDPRQAVLFGPRLGPLLVGASLGLVSFASSGIADGYGGAQANPARCFAAAIARKDMSSVAGVLLAVFYNTIPPHHTDDQQQKERQHQSNV